MRQTRNAISASAQRVRRTLIAAAVALLAACGGNDDNALVVGACDVPSLQAGLRSYMDDWYFWYQLAPRPAPGSLPTLDEYFFASLYTGTSASFPADRWSFYQSTESFNNFFGGGQSLGYGLSVAGLEVAGAPSQPLYVRYVEPLSPAAVAGIVRGDRVLSINGRSASDMIAANDFSVLSPAAAGEQIRLVLDNTGGPRTVDVTAAVFALTPVQQATVFTSAGGRKIGHLIVKDMIDQARQPLSAAFSGFAAQGVTELVLDLRYNGGGLVSIGRDLASYVHAGRTSNQAFASLLYNDRQAPFYNTTYRFNAPSGALALTRVYVLQGPRTCSASEQVINALRPFVNVVAIGDTSCGKPVGFLPVEDGCGTTYSVVNFESVNANNEGRYFDGFDPTCTVAEDFTRALGSASEPLLAAAIDHADGLGCPVASAAPREQTMAARVKRWSAAAAEGERGVMIPR